MAFSVLVTRKLPSSVLVQAQRCGRDVDLYTGDGAIPRGELRARVADKDALVCLLTDAVDAAVIDAAPALKIIANVAVGYNNIDVAVRDGRAAIVVTNTPDVLTESVADFTWALILGDHAAAVGRRAPGARAASGRAGRSTSCSAPSCAASSSASSASAESAGRWRRSAPAFGMRVAYTVAPAIDCPGAERCRSTAADDVRRRLAARAADAGDAAPDRQAALARMKRSAYLVNTARGADRGRGGAGLGAAASVCIAGAALDVYENEPSVHPGLLALENVLLAPHLGSATTRDAHRDGRSRRRATCSPCSPAARR